MKTLTTLTILCVMFLGASASAGDEETYQPPDESSTFYSPPAESSVSGSQVLQMERRYPCKCNDDQADLSCICDLSERFMCGGRWVTLQEFYRQGKESGLIIDVGGFDIPLTTSGLKSQYVIALQPRRLFTVKDVDPNNDQATIRCQLYSCPNNTMSIVAGIQGTSFIRGGDVTFNSNGDLYFTGRKHNKILKFDAASGNITTVAGTGDADYSGDDDEATQAELKRPIDVAFNAAGVLYIADLENNRIRKVTAAGIIKTVAGTGSSSYSGDDDAATQAGLYSPTSVAFNAAGDLYIATSNRIRKVTAINNDITSNSIITTVVGTGVAGYSGDGRLATQAKLNTPAGMAFNAAGDLYIADRDNNRIRRVAAINGDITSNSTITTVAGTGVADFSGDGGPATNAELDRPFDVAINAAGDLYIADADNNRIRKVFSTSGIIITVAGGGTDPSSSTPTDTLLYYTEGISFDNGDLYILEQFLSGQSTNGEYVIIRKFTDIDNCGGYVVP